MADNDCRISRQAVRAYSWEVEERLPPGSDAHDLGVILADDRDDIDVLTSPWRKFFEPDANSNDEQDPITAVIVVESQKLREKWATFYQNCPSAERVDVVTSEPTVEGTMEMVAEMMQVRQTRREKARCGKAIAKFHRFCKSLHSHSNLIKLLPEGNEYVSVFTGTINAVIRASVNHEMIAETLSEALCQIGEHIVRIKVDLELFRTTSMLAMVAKLYAHIFLFLSETMDWIMEKRRKKLMDSFNENLRQRFDRELANIASMSENIRILAEQGSRAEARVTRLTVESMGRDIRVGLEGNARHQANLEILAERLERELQNTRKEFREGKQQLARQLKQMLQYNATSTFHSRGGPFIPLRLMALPQGLETTTRRFDNELQLNADEVVLSSRTLEDFFHRDRVRLPVNEDESTRVSEETIMQVSEWVEDDSTRMLWLEGENDESEDLDNYMSMIAASFVKMVAVADMPVLSHFCELRRGEPLRYTNTQEIQAMMALVYSLLRQLIELLPPELNTNADLSEDFFRSLNGTMATWDDALGVLQDLLEEISEPVFCVIDGIHWLDDRSTDQALSQLLKALESDKLKTLFTTSGRSSCLLGGTNNIALVEIKVLKHGGQELSLDLSSLQHMMT